MLLQIENNCNETVSYLESVHNFYEELVFKEIDNCIGEKDMSKDDIADIACVALNKLPPRYVRYDIDLMFYLSQDEQEEMDNKIKNVVEAAIKIVSNSG